MFDAPPLLHRAPWATANSQLARATMRGRQDTDGYCAFDASLTADNDPQRSRAVLLSAQTKKNQDRLIDAFHVFGVEVPDAVSQFIFRHCRDLIDHKSRKSIEAVAFVGRNQNAKQRRFSWIGGNGADRNGFGCIEAVVLKNDRRSRLARVILATGDRPYFSTPQSVTRLQ